MRGKAVVGVGPRCCRTLFEMDGPFGLQERRSDHPVAGGRLLDDGGWFMGGGRAREGSRAGSWWKERGFASWRRCASEALPGSSFPGVGPPGVGPRLVPAT